MVLAVCSLNITSENTRLSSGHNPTPLPGVGYCLPYTWITRACVREWQQTASSLFHVVA